MQSQTESDLEEEMSKNERPTGILFREESYEAVQTKDYPNNSRNHRLHGFPHPSAC
jgi:hypothetical protein